jgi:hypothetical protein
MFKRATAGAMLLFISSTGAWSQTIPGPLRGVLRPSAHPVTSSQSASSGPAEQAATTRRYLQAFRIPLYTGSFDSCEPQIAEFEGQLAEFNRSAAQFMAQQHDARTMASYRPNLRREAMFTSARIDRNIAEYEKAGNRGPDYTALSLGSDLCRAKANYYTLLGIRDGLRAVAGIYPDLSEVTPLLTKTEAALAKIGGPKMIEAHIGGNRSAALAGVRLPPARGHNAALERDFQAYFTNQFPERTYLKQNLMAPDWTVFVNKLTGIPERRSIGTRLVGKSKDGRCFIHEIFWTQDYAGGRYAGDRRVIMAQDEILCSNI